ncbi:MAG: hypothetical protein KGL39_46690 [Patescibacteria group bacterium]|nr:hypothetical protein [Patescibacteria group bacterium]
MLDWIAADETETHGAWTVRERYQGLNSEQPPILLIASGSAENMKMIAGTIAAARLLASIVRTETINPVMLKMRASAILAVMGVEP